MKQGSLVFTVVALALITLFLAPRSYAAGSKKLWTNMCASCHDGKTAPDMESLRSKYKTVAEFTIAVKSKGNRCMNILKNDESLIKKIGREIGLQETEQK